MDHHVDTLVGETEKKMRLDHLERFIDQRRAVDADLATHAPGGMSERVFNGGVRQPVRAPVAKWAAGSSENHATNLRRWMSGDALQDCAMLAVDRYQFAGAGCTRLLNQVTGD